MARRPFGGTTADVAQDVAGDRVSGAQVTVWTAATGGTQLTDLQTPAGGALAGGVVTSDANGIIVFLGPADGTAVVYVDGGLGGRTKMVATDLADRVGTLESTPGGVASVAGRTGVVVLTKADVGLGNVDNTADASKPVSTAQQTALNLKANLASPAFTGTPTAPTVATSDNSTTVATTAFVKAAAGSSVASGLTPTAVKTGAYTAAAGDLVPANVTSAGFTVTLPTNPAVGTVVGVYKTDATSNTLTIAPAGGGTIDGDPNATTTTKNAGATFEHLGSNAWKIVAAYLTTGPAGPTGATGATGATGPAGPVGTGLPGWGFRTGQFYFPPMPAASAVALTEGDLLFTAYPVQASVTLAQVQIEVTGAGSTGSVIRLGIYAAGSDGMPGALVGDYGTVDSTTTGSKTLTATSTLSSGLYYLACALQGGATTAATARGCVSGSVNPWMPLTTGTTVPSSTLGCGYRQASVTGALPSTATLGTTSAAIVAQIPRVAFKVA